MFKWHHFLVCSWFVIGTSLCEAQHYPLITHEKLFKDTEVAKVFITIHPDSLALLYNNLYGNYQFPVKVKFVSSTIKDSIENVGMGLRGNTSLSAQKKSFQLTFNAHIPGQKFYGLEKMDLIGQHNDPSIIRTKLTWDLFNTFGVPAPRSNHVEVYINGNYYGLYMNVEHIDDEFCQSRFLNKDGNLYKCYWGASLEYINNSANAYKFENNGKRVYELKNNKQADDYSDLAHFIDVLNHAPLSDLPCELEKVFNVHNYLKCMAIEIIAGHWDNYIYNKNNFFLYLNTETNKFEYIPYDVDNTWGIDWMGVNWATRNCYQYKPSSQARPLYERILQVPEYNKLFSHYLKVIANSSFMSTTIFNRIDAIKTMITPSALADPFRTLDYGYTMNDFNNSYTQGIDAHVPTGIIPYINQRISTINQQLQPSTINPEIFYPLTEYPRPTDTLFFRCKVNDDGTVMDVHLIYTLNGGAANTLQLYDDGLHFDDAAGDRVYGNVLTLAQSNTMIEYHYSATDNTAQNSVLPVCGRYQYVFKPPVPSIVINEFMADNVSSYVDEYGEADDWIELYNNENEPIALGNKFLSNDATYRNKWILPDYNLAPGAYILIWCDKDGYQGNQHANFKLNKSLGTVILSDTYDNSMAIVDYVHYTLQQPDKSYSRLPNGTGDFVIQTATPLYNNNLAHVNECFQPIVTLYPNPAQDYCTIQNAPRFSSLALIDLLGQKVLTHELSPDNPISLIGIPAGLYYVQINEGKETRKQIPLIIIR